VPTAFSRSHLLLLAAAPLVTAALAGLSTEALAEEPAKSSVGTDGDAKAENNVASTDPGFNASGTATTTAPASADQYETKWVGWDTGGKDASLGFALFGHLGLEHRFDRSPMADSPNGTVVSDNGLLIGLDALVRINRFFALGLGYEHVALGQDRQDLPNQQFSEVSRAMNVLWFDARVYPLRLDPFALYINVSGGPSWQNVDVSKTNIDTFGGTTAGTTCTGSGSAGGALRPGVGAELALLSGLTFYGEVGPDFYFDTDSDLDGCPPARAARRASACAPASRSASRRPRKRSRPVTRTTTASRTTKTPVRPSLACRTTIRKRTAAPSRRIRTATRSSIRSTRA